eukprot:12454054-Prorocentrum_lima.AAC.1
MTSSLVGSEMCIRDSPKTRARPLSPTTIAVARMGRRWNTLDTLSPISAPVSYTHLTLPTICSV